jgi:hypothetical protein
VNRLRSKYKKNLLNSPKNLKSGLTRYNDGIFRSLNLNTSSPNDIRRSIDVIIGGLNVPCNSAQADSRRIQTLLTLTSLGFCLAGLIILVLVICLLISQSMLVPDLRAPGSRRCTLWFVGHLRDIENGASASKNSDSIS